MKHINVVPNDGEVHSLTKDATLYMNFYDNFQNVTCNYYYY